MQAEATHKSTTEDERPIQKEKGTVVEIKGLPYTFVPKDPDHKPSHKEPWQHLKMVPLGHTKLTSSLMRALGVTDNDLRAILDLETIHQQVKQCPVVNLPKFVRGQTSGWHYTIEHRDCGEVAVNVSVGRYPPPQKAFYGIRGQC